MQTREIINEVQLKLIINRLCYELIEEHDDFSNSAIIGLQPRGVYLADRLHTTLSTILNTQWIKKGILDATFHRDDIGRSNEVLIPGNTDIDFSVDGKKLILVDDVLFTGRTIRAGLDALMDFGRPESVELLVLIDRRFSRHLPIQPDYIGKTVDSIVSEKVKVEWNEVDGECKDKVILYTPDKK